ncbi:MAG: DUF6326 family protein [Dehalococcoidia bacterium]
MKDRKVILSTLWIFAMFNYLYADYASLLEPGMLEKIMTGSVEGIQITLATLLGGVILMETAIAMILLSRILKYRANRLANIIVGAIHTAAVLLSMVFGGVPPPYYLFLIIIEVACTLFIIWYAWTWRKQEA